MIKELKMHSVLILYCFCIWCAESSTSNRILSNKMEMIKRDDVTLSKYVYETRHDIASKSGSTPTKNDLTSTTSNPTTVPSICDVSYSENANPQRQKRSINYSLDYPTTTESADDNYSLWSDEFLNCTHTTVEPGCYEIRLDGTVYVPTYKKVFDKTNYIIRERLLYVCPNFFDEILENKYSENIDIISIVGASISSICIILHMFMFCAIQKLRNLPGYCLFSLCISLLMTYTTFFLPVMVNKQTDCTVIAMFMIYSLHSSFFWTNVTSFDIWYAIRLATSKLMLNTDKSMRKRFGLYSGYAWGMPLLIIAVALIGDHFTVEERFKLTFSDTRCWFKNKNALLIYFASPVFIMLVANVIFCVDSFRMVIRSRADSGSEEAFNLRSRLFLSLRLGSAMGLMWVFGVIANLTQSEWIDYLHALCTALQGVFIFFSFTLNERTKKVCKKVMKSKKISMLSILSQRRKTSAFSMTESISSNEK